MNNIGIFFATGNMLLSDICRVFVPLSLLPQTKNSKKFGMRPSNVVSLQQIKKRITNFKNKRL